MLRARLWYGPAGHDVALERVARYLRGPLACELRPAQRRHHGQWRDVLELRQPVPATIEITRHPEVAGDAALLAARLPPEAPKALGKRLGACTARLEIQDTPGKPPFLPATAVARSVLVPLAYAMDGYVEDVETGRVIYHPKPEDSRGPNPLRAALEALRQALRR